MREDRIPNDIYRQCVVIAKSYYAMLQRRRELEESILLGSASTYGGTKARGHSDPTARKAERLIAAKERNEWKIRAVEQAWNRIGDDTAKEFIKKNVFEGIGMQYLGLPLSIRTMKRMRAEFISLVAEELGETWEKA